MRAIFLKCSIRENYWKLFFLFLFLRTYGEVSSLNNADPYPIFGAKVIANFLTADCRRSIKDTLNIYVDDADDIEEIFSFSVSPFYQSATDGVTYYGDDTLTYYDNSNTNVASDSASQAATGNPISSSSIPVSVPMPLGAIPEPWNMFGLFYPYKLDDINKQTNNELYPLIDNRTSKVFARYLGFGHISDFKLNDTASTEIFDPLNSGYFNYRNYHFNIMSNPMSRDPQKLFGYMYMNFDYEKYGVRCQSEIKITPSIGLKISSGIAHVAQQNLQLEDTTTNSYGPSVVHMLALTDRTVTATGDFSGGTNTISFLQPNIQALTPFSVSNLDGGISDDYIGLDAPGLLGAGVSDADNTAGIRNPHYPDQFKAQYLQNIQNNLRGLTEALDLDFTSYQKTEIEDPQIELYFRKVFVYNSETHNEQSKKHKMWPVYALIPHCSVHATCPTSSRVKSNMLFAKPISNNGHWSAGGSIGLIIDFLRTVAVHANVGFSVFNKGLYCKKMVPTNMYQEGIYPYTGDFNITPGANFTLGLGMTADHFYNNLSFSGEYRLVRHNEDYMDLLRVNCPFERTYTDNLLQRYELSTGIVSEKTYYSEFNIVGATSIDANNVITTVPTLTVNTSQDDINDNANDALDVVPGILYFGGVKSPSENVGTVHYFTTSAPLSDYYPRVFVGDSMPFDNTVDDAIANSNDVLSFVKYLEERSSFVVHTFNMALSCAISEYMSLGMFLQQPFSLRNAYNSMTFGITFDMMF